MRVPLREDVYARPAYQVVEIGLPEKSCRLQAVGSIDLDSESPHNFGKEWRSASMGRSTRSSNRSSRPEAGRRAPGRGTLCGAVPPGCVPITDGIPQSTTQGATVYQ